MPPAPVLSPNPEDLDDPVDEEPSDAIFKPTTAQMSDLTKMHDNMGHPSNEDFARILKLGNVKAEVWKWVRHHFKCEHCQATKLPRAKRPAAIPRTYAFNHIVGADLVVIKNLDGHPQNWLNVLCWGTSYQQFRILPGDNSKSSANVWACFVDTWIRMFGHPNTLVVDPGLEFEGMFAEQVQAHGITLLPTDARSPWQNGRTERAGGLVKRLFKIACRKHSPTSQQEFETLAGMCVAHKNNHYNRSGYTPHTRVFGRAMTMPTSILSDNAVDPLMLNDNPNEDFIKAEGLRRAAQRAWSALDTKSRMAKALRARHHTIEVFTEGQLVFVWRQPQLVLAVG